MASTQGTGKSKGNGARLWRVFLLKLWSWSCHDRALLKGLNWGGALKWPLRQQGDTWKGLSLADSWKATATLQRKKMDWAKAKAVRARGTFKRELSELKLYELNKKCQRSLQCFQFELWVNEDITEVGWLSFQLFIKYFQLSPILLGHMLGLHSLASFCLLTSLMPIKVYRPPVIRWVCSGV